MFNSGQNQSEILKLNATGRVIPDICQFWWTATLFRPVKSTPKNAKIGRKEQK